MCRYRYHYHYRLSVSPSLSSSSSSPSPLSFINTPIMVNPNARRRDRGDLRAPSHGQGSLHRFGAANILHFGRNGDKGVDYLLRLDGSPGSGSDPQRLRKVRFWRRRGSVGDKFISFLMYTWYTTCFSYGCMCIIFFLFPGVFFRSRKIGACPVTTDFVDYGDELL